MAGFGLRGLALIVAIVLFIIAVFDDGDYRNLIALGLACLAAAFLASELPGWRRRT